MHEDQAIVLSPALRERLLTTITQRLPQKSFGYLLSDVDAYTPTDFILFNANIRNDEMWKEKFESYGQYFVEHEDAGFVATPEESWQVQKEIWARGMFEIGVFHSHLRHPANFSGIDFDLHTERFDNLWHMIISMRSPALPQLRVFSVSRSGVRELPVVAQIEDTWENELTEREAESDAAIARARVLLALDEAGRPRHQDRREILAAIHALLSTGHREAIAELLTHGFLRHSARRFEEYLAPRMQLLDGGHFKMGTDASRARHFCGEVPSHSVELSPFHLAQVPITNELFGLFDQRWLTVPIRDLQKPATCLNWFDATIFALWMACRLPTEAEWEFACGCRSRGEWCCEDERDLARYAWYSENARGVSHAVGTRSANSFGLYDLHGNVWEWCQDSYEQNYYACSPVTNPVNALSTRTLDRVCRGGSIHALAEMCRTRYRFHEPAGFQADDLGFRVARSVDNTSAKGQQYG